MYPVCQNSYDGRFKAHTDAQERITEIVNAEIERDRLQNEQFKAQAKKLLDEQSERQRQYEEINARETEERSYRDTLSFYHEHFNHRALKELYAELKEIVN